MLHVDMHPVLCRRREFLTEGRVMEKGELSSYNSYNPPGTFYLMIPGMLLNGDPRLQDLPGTVLLVFGTLVFLYLAIREAAGRAVALAAALAYRYHPLGVHGIVAGRPSAFSERRALFPDAVDQAARSLGAGRGVGDPRFRVVRRSGDHPRSCSSSLLYG